MPPALRVPQQRPPAPAKEAEEVSAELASARSEAARGHWEFEQRMAQHEAGEQQAMAAARQLRHHLRRRAAGAL